jgi:hypothetical protein
MALRDLQIEQKVPSKCGIEVRDYTPKHYGGYYYHDSLEEGYDRCQIIKKEVKSAINKKVADSVLLKRACTEYEMVLGPSSHWYMNYDQHKLLEYIECYLADHQQLGNQSEMCKDNVIYRWMIWAHSHGDMTYKKWNDGEAIWPGYERFDDKPLEQIKQEIAIKKGVTIGGLEPKQSYDVLNDTFELANKHKINVNSIYHMTTNKPFNTLNFVQTTPDVLKGDHDEFTG